MDKIFELICAEARRRPGERLVPKLYQVKLEMDQRVGELILKLVEAEKEVDPVYHLNRGKGNDTGLKP